VFVTPPGGVVCVTSGTCVAVSVTPIGDVGVGVSLVLVVGV
jgi:hypothetical protein